MSWFSFLYTCYVVCELNFKNMYTSKPDVNVNIFQFAD